MTRDRPQPPSESDHRGRLHGGLRHVRGAALVVKHKADSWKSHLTSFGWSVASGVVGSGIGLLAAALYLRVRGW
jgi:hypothetical protein